MFRGPPNLDTLGTPFGLHQASKPAYEAPNKHSFQDLLLIRILHLGQKGIGWKGAWHAQKNSCVLGWSPCFNLSRAVPMATVVTRVGQELLSLRSDTLVWAPHRTQKVNGPAIQMTCLLPSTCLHLPFKLPEIKAKQALPWILPVSGLLKGRCKFNLSPLSELSRIGLGACGRLAWQRQPKTYKPPCKQSRY